MFASIDDPHAFLVHDIRFHRSIAAACGNPILASLVEMISALFYEQRRKTVHQGRDLKEAAQMHRTIYHAVRAHDPKRARAAMHEHLAFAQQAQSIEPPRDVRAATGTADAPMAPPSTAPLPRPMPWLPRAPIDRGRAWSTLRSGIVRYGACRSHLLI